MSFTLEGLSVELSQSSEVSSEEMANVYLPAKTTIKRKKLLLLHWLQCFSFLLLLLFFFCFFFLPFKENKNGVFCLFVCLFEYLLSFQFLFKN